MTAAVVRRVVKKPHSANSARCGYQARRLAKSSPSKSGRIGFPTAKRSLSSQGSASHAFSGSRVNVVVRPAVDRSCLATPHNSREVTIIRSHAFTTSPSVAASAHCRFACLACCLFRRLRLRGVSSLPHRDPRGNTYWSRHVHAAELRRLESRADFVCYMVARRVARSTRRLQPGSHFCLHDLWACFWPQRKREQRTVPLRGVFLVDR